MEKPRVENRRLRSFAQAVAEVIFGYLALVWLLLIPHFPFLLMGPGVYALNGSPFALGQVWIEFYWVVLAVTVVQSAWNSFALWRGDWQGPRTAYQLASKVFGLAVFSVLLATPGHTYLVLRHPAVDQAQYGAKLDQINLWIWYGVAVLCTILAIQLLWEFAKGGSDAYRSRRTGHSIDHSRENGY